MERIGMKQDTQYRIVISGGGTGGHVYPGIAIAQAVRQTLPGVEITFVGVKNRIEEKIVPREGYPLKTIHVEYIARKLSLKSFTFIFSLLVGLVQSILFLIRYRPHVVVGTGGYVCGPVVYAAHLLGIPTLIQEQNSYPGITTKILASRVDEIHLAFEEARHHLKKVRDDSKFKITGNPVRMSTGGISRAEALAKFGLDTAKKTLLLFGGSQGAAALNKAMLETLPLLATDIQLIWQTGESDFEPMKRACAALPHRLYIQPFIYTMSEAYACADLAFCRSGAITIAELVQSGLPAIFVPLPHAAEGHQEKNARVLMDAGAAEMILQKDLTPTLLADRIRRLIFDEEKLSKIKANSQKFYHPSSAKMIADSVIRLMQGK
ncbi:MAG: undecaprenyldiphospho-muramoylpentapeptide beta-N-acetylglucosaminyltransferase [Candidatus Zhuqueibacterota bacterium]